MGRVRDETGSATVLMLLLMLSLTGGAVLWLSRDVDRAINTAAEADSVAFQAARAAAQGIDPGSLRSSTPRIDADAARQRAIDAAAQMLAANGSVGTVTAVEVSPDGDRVTVVVQLIEAGRAVTGRGTARLAVGVAAEGDSP